jgi:hypothetical protein
MAISLDAKSFSSLYTLPVNDIRVLFVKAPQFLPSIPKAVIQP